MAVKVKKRKALKRTIKKVLSSGVYLKKTVAKKTVAKKTVAKKTVAKKTVAKKTVGKKIIAKKVVKKISLKKKKLPKTSSKKKKSINSLKKISKKKEKNLNSIINVAKIEKELFNEVPLKYKTKIKKLVRQCKKQGYVTSQVLTEHLSLDKCNDNEDIWSCIENILKHNCIDLVEESGVLQEVEIENNSRFLDPDNISNYDSIQMYLRDIGKYKLLTAKEEVELSEKIKKYINLKNKKTKKQYTLSEKRKIIKEGIEARDKLATSNLRLVISIAKNYASRKRSLSLLDLAHEGTKGLYKAAEKFDASRGFKFSTYATWWIKQAVVRGIADKSKTIRVPVHMSETSQRCEKATVYLEQALGRPPTIQELSAELGVEPERVHMIRRISQDVVQLDRPIGDDMDGGTKIVDTIEDDNSDTPEMSAAREILKEQIQEILSELSTRERKVIELRNGMRDDGVQYTLEQIGKKLGVTRERVRQIESRAIERLRVNKTLKKLESY